jgi:translocation and assembly module TamB
MKKWLLLPILLLLAGFFAGATWLVYTPSGARFFIHSLSRVVPANITTGAVDGTLARTLAIRDVKVVVPKVSLTISVRSLKLSWRPAHLLDGTVAIDRLHLEDVTVADNRPWNNEPFVFAWPRLPRLLLGLQGSIGEFRTERVRYDRVGEAVLPVSHIEARISWHGGVLGLRDLSMDSPYFTAGGGIDAGFLRPLFKANVTVAPRPMAAGFTRLVAKMELTPTRGAKELAGPLSLKTTLRTGGQAALEARIRLLKEKIEIEGFQLAYSGLRGNAKGDGVLVFGNDKPYFRLKGSLIDVRPGSGTGGAIALTGNVRVEGMPNGYKGAFSLEGRVPGPKDVQWRSGQATGTIEGDLGSCQAIISSGTWLGGKIAGNVKASWRGQTSVEASLRGRGFKPEYLSPDWTGVVNADADLRIDEAKGAGFGGTIRVSFPESTLRGKTLTGDLAATFGPGLFRLEKLRLSGKGFDIRGSGVLDEKLLFDVAVTDLGGLVPATSGSLVANGWLRWKAGQPTGTLTGRGSNIILGNGKIEKTRFSGQLGDGGTQQITIDIQAQGAAYGDMRVDTVSLSVAGSRENHVAEGHLRLGPREAHFALQGGQSDRSWTGSITRLSGKDTTGNWTLAAPARLFASRDHLQVGRLRLSSQKKESLTVEGDVFFDPFRGTFIASWDTVDLGHFEPFFPAASPSPPIRPDGPSPTKQSLATRGNPTLKGATTGNISVQWPNARGRSIEGQATLTGRYKQNSLDVPVKAQIRANWKENGLDAAWEMTSQAGGKVVGRLSATGPPGFKLPEKAMVNAEWKGFDIALFHDWLPTNVSVKGLLSGTIEGTVVSGGGVVLSGQTALDQGVASWLPGDGAVTASIQTGGARFTWAGTSLQGEFALALAKYGKMEGRFSLPLPARLPPAFTADGPLALTLKGQVREQGLISALFPTVLHETKGILDLDATAGGTWQKPNFTGGVTLKDAGAAVPAAGIKIEHVQGAASLGREGIDVRLRAESGGGWLQVAGDVRTRSGEGLRYQGSVKGDGFQVLNLPDVRAFITPRLTFQGDGKLLSARGEIDVPRMSIYGRQGDAVVRPSADIVVVDAPVREKRTSPVGLDVKVRVILGDKVLVESRGIDARLAGALDVDVAAIDRITARGRINIVDGGYKAYGIRLAITRGIINFVGPVERPTLDVLAVKKTKDVTAGVQVTGTAQAPVVNLYSSPSMSESDKLSYIILGRRLTTTDSGEGGAIAGAAGMFEGGATPTMTSEARKRLGLTGPPGTTAQEEAAQSMVNVGRYLTSSFYVGIGRSLATNANLFTLRYSFSEKWEAESRLGQETGMDIFYRIEFD